ncbi:hypothetical protein CN380_12265 [Bacillus sp. AFS017274]|nr:hypothetical protein CN380_12265 [Bacillus sp. AFS017274]
MNVEFHSRYSLSAGGPGSLLGAFCACGVSPGRAFPAGVSHTRSNQLCFKNLDRKPFVYKKGGNGLIPNPFHDFTDG